MRIVVISGGVISGVGKGIATASIAKIIKEYGFSVTAVKIDPYINYDAGTLRPTEHGEVWVTDDGGEIDQDLGNYERYLGIDIPRKNNITTGQIYKELIDKERRGGFLGKTVEVIPHVPNEIKRRILEAGKDFEFVLVEIGGTIGDYQNIPYLFAVKSMEIEMGKENIANILVTYLPIPAHVGEMKTKPTQQSIRMLNEAGIFPDFVLCRSINSLDDIRKKKIEIYANISSENIISAPDIRSIYRVPLNLEKENFGTKILRKFNIEKKKQPNWDTWAHLVDRIENPSNSIDIAMIGKYVDIGDYTLADSYISVNQALEHAGAELDVGVRIHWIDSKKLENKEKLKELEKYTGIIVPGGFGTSGVEGKIDAIKFARENNIPCLGLCYGMQLAVVEYARNVCGLKANSTENDAHTEAPVIDIQPSQKGIMEKNMYGGTMRLGAYTAILKKSLVLDLYKKTQRLNQDMKKIEIMKNSTEQFRLGILNGDNIVLERHRHRYEVNPLFIDKLSSEGLIFSGYHMRIDETKLMEFIELKKHKFFVATQAHPEFKSRLENPAPLFLGFVEACIS